MALLIEQKNTRRHASWEVQVLGLLDSVMDRVVREGAQSSFEALCSPSSSS